jgi:hypothetical protein
VLSSLSGSTKLKKLFLVRCGLDRDSMRYISQLPNLEELDIGGNEKVSDDDLQFLLPLKHLSHVNIYNCPGITPDGIKYFQKMSLETLGMGRNQYRASVRRAWKAAIPKCEFQPMDETSVIKDPFKVVDFE